METVVIIKNILISLGIYFGISSSLVIIDGKPKENIGNESNLQFEELDIDYREIPDLNTYSCRDSTKLNYRYYPSQSNNVIILLHGSAWHSRYFLPLANYISSENLAHVYTPDLRGHGEKPTKRGDIDYIKQLEDDIADLVLVIREKHPKAKLTVGGHSSGGGLALRFAGSQYRNEADAYLLISPYLKYNAPTTRKNSGGWASVHTPRIIGLSMLNSSGIRVLNHLPVIDFNLPEAYRDGTETLTYSYRLNTGYAPKNYRKDLKKMEQPLLILVGGADESFVPEEYLPLVSKYKQDVNVTIVDSMSHMGIVMNEGIRPVLKQWINSLDKLIIE